MEDKTDLMSLIGPNVYPFFTLNYDCSALDSFSVLSVFPSMLCDFKLFVNYIRFSELTLYHPLRNFVGLAAASRGDARTVVRARKEQRKRRKRGRGRGRELAIQWKFPLGQEVK